MKNADQVEVHFERPTAILRVSDTDKRLRRRVRFLRILLAAASSVYGFVLVGPTWGLSTFGVGLVFWTLMTRTVAVSDE